MIFKNGRLFHTPSVLRKRPINKSGRLIFKNGRLFHKLGFEKIISQIHSTEILSNEKLMEQKILCAI